MNGTEFDKTLKECNVDKKHGNYFKKYTINDIKDTIDLGVLPEGWIQLRHVSGISIYLHRPSRVVTVSRPYAIGPGSVKHHRLPVSAIPCLAFRRNVGTSYQREPESEKIQVNHAIEEEPLATSPAALSVSVDEALCESSPPGLADEQHEEVMPELKAEEDIKNGVDVSDYQDREEGELSSAEEEEADEDDFSNTAGLSSQPKRWCPEVHMSDKDSVADTVNDKKCATIVPIDTTSHAVTGTLDTEITAHAQDAELKSENSTSCASDRTVGISICKVGAFPRRRRRRRQTVASFNPRHAIGTSLRLSDSQRDLASGGTAPNLDSIKCQVISVHDKESESLLTPEEIRAYCCKLFPVTVEEVLVKRKCDGDADDNEITAPSKDCPQQPLPILPGSAKVIRYHVPTSTASTGSNSQQQQPPPQEGVINMTGKSFVCILHEYCQNVIRRPPTYHTEVLENTQTPYQMNVVIDGVSYAAGVGQSKRQARLEAARKALEHLIPDFEKMVSSTVGDTGGGQQSVSEQDIQVFDSVSLTDPRLFELSLRMAMPAPYSILTECLNRSCVPETDLKANMLSQGRHRHFFTLDLHDHAIKVPCKNKREGRHLAAQHLLARLHPEVTQWSALLRMYGPGSKPDKRGEPEPLQDGQSQQKSTVKTNLIRLLKTKMQELADQLEKTGTISLKGKFVVPPDHLPVVAFHSDSKSDLYNSMPAPDSPVLSSSQPVSTFRE